MNAPIADHYHQLLLVSHISNLPRADAKCGHKGISHFVHENKRIGPSHRKKNKRENDESMDGKTDHNCYDEQG